jgi:hypothetical protein
MILQRYLIILELEMGGFLDFVFQVLYSTLIHLPPSRFHCVRVYDNGLLGLNPGQLRIESQTL